MTTLLKTTDLDIRIGNVNVCHQLNWEVKTNEVWGILGLNGIGKTTLLKTLAGFRQPDKGSIEVKGKSLNSYSRKQLAQILGFLFQELPHDFPQTLQEYCSNVFHPQLERWQGLTEEHRNRIAAALRQVDLDNLQQRLVNSLSGGEQRRAEIACLLLQNPDIWLLDEPLNHLDLHHQITMMQNLIQSARQKSGTVISILHDANLALRFCTHVLLLQGNGHHQTGISEQLLTSDNLTALYQHPVVAVKENGRTAFLAD